MADDKDVQNLKDINDSFNSEFAEIGPEDKKTFGGQPSDCCKTVCCIILVVLIVLFIFVLLALIAYSPPVQQTSVGPYFKFWAWHKMINNKKHKRDRYTMYWGAKPELLKENGVAGTGVFPTERTDGVHSQYYNRFADPIVGDHSQHLVKHGNGFVDPTEELYTRY